MEFRLFVGWAPAHRRGLGLLTPGSHKILSQGNIEKGQDWEQEKQAGKTFQG